MSIDFVILAAGVGSRMKTAIPKIFHEIAGKPLIRYIIDVCKNFSQNIIVVTQEKFLNHEYLSDTTNVTQQSPRGTADAVLRALPYIKSDNVAILCGDMPLIENRDIEALLNIKGNALATAELPDELSDMPYGRVITNNGKAEKIIEYKDATGPERRIPLINTGVYKLDVATLKRYIGEIEPNQITNELYLTDIFAKFWGNNIDVDIVKASDYWAFHGVNTLEDLAKAEHIMQDRLRKRFMASGVNLLDPATTYFSADTQIANNVVIEPNVVIKKGVTIHENVRINAFSHLAECEIMRNVEIGPFARIRGNSRFMENSSVGNFVEVKGSTFGEHSKAKHLSYIGDTTIGTRSNIGAGTITCNYDGVKKYKTEIGDDAFIGSNSTLIAPVKIEDNTIVAAGSVINRRVPANALAIARGRQTNIEDKARQIWEAKGKR